MINKEYIEKTSDCCMISCTVREHECTNKSKFIPEACSSWTRSTVICAPLSCCMSHDLVCWLALCLRFPGWPHHVFPVRSIHRAAGLRYAEHHGGVWLVHLLCSYHILPRLPGLCQQGKRTATQIQPEICLFRIPHCEASTHVEAKNHILKDKCVLCIKLNGNQQEM